MRRTLIVGSAVLATVGLAIGVFLTGQKPGDDLWPIAWLMWAPVGALILYRRPGNGVGWTQLVIGLSYGLSFIALSVAVNAENAILRGWSDLISAILGSIPWLGIVWLLLIFPTGWLVRRVERITGAAVLLFGGWAVVAFAIGSAPMEATQEASPLAVPALGWTVDWLAGDSGFWVPVLLVVAAMVSLVTRWRGSRGLERHQYRWLLFGSGFFGVVVLVGQVLPGDTRFDWVWLVAINAIPTVIGVAVLRYRLYEIDRVVSRTLAYAIVAALLVSAVLLVSTLVGTRFESPFVVAATTLGVAAVFNPLRRRVQRVVDRRFNRSRYDHEKVMDGFAGSLRDETDSARVIEGWLAVVAETMQPERVGVWVKM